ncbi:MAG: hypothetical protein WAZ71_07220 [Bifidobacterium adolescentis]
MSDNESNAGRSRVPAASFSRLSATRVVLGLDKAQLIVCVIGLDWQRCVGQVLRGRVPVR